MNMRFQTNVRISMIYTTTFMALHVSTIDPVQTPISLDNVHIVSDISAMYKCVCVTKDKRNVNVYYRV